MYYVTVLGENGSQLRVSEHGTLTDANSWADYWSALGKRVVVLKPASL